MKQIFISCITLIIVLLAVPMVAMQQKTPFFSIKAREQAKQDYYAKLKAKPWGNIAELTIQELEAEEKDLMEEFYALTGHTAESWQRYVHNAIDENALFLTETFETNKELELLGYTECTDNVENTMFHSLLDACTINPKYIKEYVTEEQSSSSYLNGITYIGLPKKYDNQEQRKALILHEIMHILHNDTLTHWVINSLPIDALDNNPECKNLKTRLYTFKEKRCDLLVGLLAPEHAYHLAEFFGNESHFFIDHYIHDNTTHPTALERFLYVQQLHQKMEPDAQPPQHASIWKTDEPFIVKFVAEIVFLPGISFLDYLG